MKISFKQKIKNLVAIVLIILSMLIIKNNLNKKISNIQSITNDISIVKVKSGSSIYEKKSDELNLITTAKNKLLLTQNINLITKDTKAPNNISSISAEIKDDNIIVKFDIPHDRGDNYEYLVRYENNEELLKFYSKSGIKGYSYKINNYEKDTADEVINKTDNDPFIVENIDFSKNYYLHIRTVDKNNNFSSSNTYKIDIPSNGVNVEYIQSDTNKIIAPTERIEGMINDQYNAENLEKSISGYTFVNVKGNTKGLLKKDIINVKYNYVKNN